MSGERDDLENSFFVAEGERDPMRSAAQGGRPVLPKRFYKQAEAAPVEGGFAVLLDGKPVRTPAKRPLVAPHEGLGRAMAAEWAAQEEFLNPLTMPLTKLANSAIDGVASQMAEVEADAVKYAGSDLICYRAGGPEGLVKAQAEAWDPYLRFAREKCGARLILSEGVVFHAQPPEALEGIAARVRAHVGEGPAAPFRLAALHTITTLTGSCVIALAVALREMDAEAAFKAAHVDEDYQMRVWGADEEAIARRARRLADMLAAAQMSAFCAEA
ncbi:MAG: ATP12 family protein [Methylocystis sp.]|jgi:chaperone required for assembly of F1-ATPase